MKFFRADVVIDTGVDKVPHVVILKAADEDSAVRATKEYINDKLKYDEHIDGIFVQKLEDTMILYSSISSL